MTEKTLSPKPLCYVFYLTLVGLFLVFVMAGAAPLLYVFFLAAIIPATAYLFLRTKWFVLATPALLGIVLLLNYNIIYILCLPLLFLGVWACVAAAKSGKLFFGVALVISSVFLGLALPIWTATMVSGKNAGETVAAYILTREDDSAIVNMAKNFIFESEVADAVTRTPHAPIQDIEREAALFVSSLSTEDVLARYSLYAKDVVNGQLLHFVFSTGAMIAMTAFLLLTVLISSYQYLLAQSCPPKYMHKTEYRMTSPRHMIMPRNYALFVLAPYIVLSLISFAPPFFEAFFEATYYGVILVPFGFAGVGLVYYLLRHWRLNLGYSTLIVFLFILPAFLGVTTPFLVLSMTGMIDYFLNLRFIIEHYQKQKKGENK